MMKSSKKILKFGRMLQEQRPLSQLRRFLDNNEVDLNSSELGVFYETALHLAVNFHSDVNVFDLLISYGANPDVCDCLGDSVLHYAVWNLACPQMVKRVLDAGISFTTVNEDENRPIHLAAKGGNIPAIEILLEAGEDVNACGQWLQTPLHFAAMGYCDNARETITFLLDHGADLWAKADNGFLPIVNAHHSDEVLPFFASIMPGKIKEWDSDEYIPFSEFIQKFGCYRLGSALVGTGSGNHSIPRSLRPITGCCRTDGSPEGNPAVRSLRMLHEARVHEQGKKALLLLLLRSGYQTRQKDLSGGENRRGDY